jgi:oligopeptide transport system substrate-binding protein
MTELDNGIAGKLPVLLVLIILCHGMTAQCAGIDVEHNSITLSLRSEPPSLDSTLQEDVDSYLIITHIQEGLVNLNRRGEIIPGVARKWEFNDREITFWLREDAKWSDGKPVTAEDFSYALRRLVDPKTGAGGTAAFVHLFENGTDILNGRKPGDALGIEVIDPYTLKIRLSIDAPYMLYLFTGSPYLPLRQDFVEAQKGRYAADAMNLLSNGPFMVESWVHGASLKLIRNPHYWNSDRVQLEALNFAYMTPDFRAKYNLFKSGELASFRINATLLNDAMEDGLRIHKAPMNCTSWVATNFDQTRPTSNIHFRRAISHAIDRDTYADKIVGLPGAVKVDSIFPSSTRGAAAPFQNEYPAEELSYDILQAKESLQAAKRELGGEMQPLSLLVSEVYLLQAEFLQAQLTNNLGIEVRIDTQTFKQYLVKLTEGDFDLSLAGFCWGALTDPIGWVSLFTDSSAWNAAGYNNPEYNRLEQRTHHSQDIVERMSIFGRLQEILSEDRVVVPLTESSYVYLQDRRLKGVTRSPEINFSTGRIAN